MKICGVAMMSSCAAWLDPMTELLYLLPPIYLEKLKRVGLKTLMKETPSLGRMQRVPGVKFSKSCFDEWFEFVAPLRRSSTN